MAPSSCTAVLCASCPAAKMGQGLGAPTMAFVLDKTRCYGEGCSYCLSQNPLCSYLLQPATSPTPHLCCDMPAPHSLKCWGNPFKVKHLKYNNQRLNPPKKLVLYMSLLPLFVILLRGRFYSDNYVYFSPIL